MRVFLVIASLLAVSMPSVVAGQMICRWDASLDGSKTVPPTDSPGWASMDAMFITGDGYGYCCSDLEHVDDDSLHVELRYGELAGSVSGAYIHAGTEGTNGDRLYALWDEYFESGSECNIWIELSHCIMLDYGELYLLITTDLHPEGEVRGQITYVPIPTVDVTWGRIRAEYR